MKSFEHDTDAHAKIKLKRLIQKYSIHGYGAWWIVVEIVGLEGIGGYLEFEKYPLVNMSKEIDMAEEMAKGFINFCGEIKLIDPLCLPKAIHIPSLPERADDYTKRIMRDKKIEYTKSVRTKSEDSQSTENRPRHFISIFINKHKEYIGTGYLPSWGRDCKLMKELLIAYGENDLTAIIEEFFKASEDSDTWWADKVSIPVLKSCAYSVVGRLRKKK